MPEYRAGSTAARFFEAYPAVLFRDKVFVSLVVCATVRTASFESFACHSSV